MSKTFLKIISVLSLLLPAAASADVNGRRHCSESRENIKVSGDEIISGVRIAVEDINARGGLNGEKINLITRSMTNGDDGLAVSTAQMMAVNTSPKDKMSLVIGPYCDNAFDEVAAIYAKANIFQIIPTTISAREATKNHKGLVKMVGYKDRQGKDFYNYYKNNFADKRVALVYDSNNREIVEIAAAIQGEFRKEGDADKLRAFSFETYNQNYGRLADAIFKNNIDLAYILGKSRSIAKLSKELKSEKKDFVIFTNKYQAQDDFNRIMGDLAEGSYFIALPSLKDNPNFAETLVKLRLLGVEPEGLSVYGYSAVKLWEELVEKADSFSYNKLASVLNSQSVDTGWGETMFNNGNPQNSINYGIYQLQSGEYTQVY